jgi:hypothetical protein
MTIIDLFILAYVLMALFWHLPGSRLWSKVLDPLAPLICWLGLEQDWGMFAPDPATSDRDLAVILELPTGGALLWEPPRLHALSRWDAFLAFRYRSYEHAILYDDESPECRAALAEYLLRKYEFSGDRPRGVVFFYVDRPLPPPGAADPPPPTTRAAFYTYRPSGEPR